MVLYGFEVKKSGSQLRSKNIGHKSNSGGNIFGDPVETKKKDQQITFQYKEEGKMFDFEFKTDKRVQCPICKSDYKNILRHLQKTSCKIHNLEVSRLQK